MVDDEKKSNPALLQNRGPNHPWENIASDWRNRFVRLAYRFLWNWDDAEDAVQDALTVAQNKVEQLKDPEKWWSWATRIVVNQCHEQLRQRDRRQKSRMAFWENCTVSHDQTIDQAELAEILKELIDKLPERQRSAVVLRYLEGQDYKEIAVMMEISESTVRVHVLSAREELRKMILRHYPEWAKREE
ncbi:MAG: RNA polymerase sigma factor [Phycisphaerae bacterium]